MLDKCLYSLALVFKRRILRTLFDAFDRFNVGGTFNLFYFKVEAMFNVNIELSH